MLDFFKRPLVIDDIIAFNPPRYKGMHLGKVIGFTPKMVKVEYNWQGYTEVTTQWPQDLVKKSLDV